MYLLLFYLFVAIEWTFPRFILKQLTDYFNTIEIMVLVHLSWHLFMLLFFSYIWIFENKKKTEFIDKLYNLPVKYKLKLILIIIIGFVGQYSLITLLKSYNVSTVLPIVRGLSTICVLAFGYYMFKENITLKKVLGILIILAGIMMVK